MKPVQASTIRELQSVHEMGELAHDLFKRLSLPSIFLLEGELGVGKTSFVKFFCKFLGVKEKVNSPGFNLLNTYQAGEGGITIYHLDLYRLSSDENPQMEDFLDIQEESYVCFVEWPHVLGTNWSRFAAYMGAKTHRLFFKYGDHETHRFVDLFTPR